MSSLIYTTSLASAAVEADVTTRLDIVTVFGQVDRYHPLHRSLCVYDPVGAQGVIKQQFDDLLIIARDAGIDFDVRAYTDEGVVAGDLKAGRCDAAVVTGIRAKQFVSFSGSLDMAGGLQTYAQEKTAIDVMASDKAAPLMSEGLYEVAGVVPGGKVYLFSRERSFLDSLSAAAGRKVAVIGFDRQAEVVANAAGTAPVAATLASFGPLFNNHAVDMAYAPAIAFVPFELYKGMGQRGGVADFVLGMLSLQIVIRRSQFPVNFGAVSRRWAADMAWDRAMPFIRRADASIPSRYWVHINGERETKYRQMLREVRQQLWNEDWYNHRMQRLLKKIRCADDAGLAECSLDTEGGVVN